MEMYEIDNFKAFWILRYVLSLVFASVLCEWSYLPSSSIYYIERSKKVCVFFSCLFLMSFSLAWGRMESFKNSLNGTMPIYQNIVI